MEGGPPNMPRHCKSVGTLTLVTQINHQENHLKAALVQLFPATLQRTVPPEQWSKYLMTKGEWSELDVSRASSLIHHLAPAHIYYLALPPCSVRVRRSCPCV